MGNENTHVSDGNKAQLDNASSPVYQLVNLNGGELMDLMKVARRTKDYRELDAAIISKVKPHLYNGGDGKMVSVREIVLRRSGDWKKQKSTSDRKKVEDVPMTDINIDCERNGNTQKGKKCNKPRGYTHVNEQLIRGSIRVIYILCYLNIN